MDVSTIEDTLPPTLREHSEAVLRELLVQGRLKPGQRVNEVELSESLGVSRGTLREAIRSLQQDGLLASVPRRGVFVRLLTSEEATEIQEVRLSLEITAARKVCTTLDDSKRRRLESAYARLLEVRDQDFAARLRADHAFHELVCIASGNAALLRTWRSLMGTVTIMLLSVGPADVVELLLAPEEHLRLLKALEDGDPEAIDAAWRGHFTAGLGYILEHFKLRRANGGPEALGPLAGAP